MKAVQTPAADGKKSHVSVTEHDRAKQNLDTKYSELERIVQAKKWSEYPDKGYLLDFCEWEDDTKGLKKVARSILYDTLIEERKKAASLLKQLRAGRLQRPVQDDEVAKLKERLEASERKAQTYVNQFVAISIEVDNLREEVKTLTDENARLAAKINKVSPIRGVTPQHGGQEHRQ